MNMGSILVYGGTIVKRQEKTDEIICNLDSNLVKKEHPDRLTLTKEDSKKNVGISQVRKIVEFLSTKPYSSKYKVVVIESADKMTTQAQNALLKTLEEPPFFAIIILNSKTEQSLLPTVLSRCRKIRADGGGTDIFEDDENVIHFAEVLSYSIGEKLKLAENISKKDDDYIIDLLEFWVREERFEMTKNQKTEKYKNIEMILEFLNDIENTNVNKRLALETLFMNV